MSNSHVKVKYEVEKFVKLSCLKNKIIQDIVCKSCGELSLLLCSAMHIWAGTKLRFQNLMFMKQNCSGKESVNGLAALILLLKFKKIMNSKLLKPVQISDCVS